MSSRKFDFKTLTDDQLDTIARDYPDAIETVTIRRPIYKKLAMMAECKARLSDGRTILDLLAADEPAVPPLLRKELANG